MFLLHFLSEFVLYNLHLVSILNQVNFTLPLAIHTINKKMNFFWKPYTRWGINSMQYTMATHKVIQNIGHLLWGFTFDLSLASHQWILFTKPDENLKIWYKHRKHELINWWLFDCWIKGMIENMAAPFCKSVKHIMVNSFEYKFQIWFTERDKFST